MHRTKRDGPRTAAVRPLGVLLTATIVSACGAGKAAAPAPAPAPVPTAVPAGVDSSVAAHADSVADLSFVGTDEQDEATALWEEAREQVSRSDSLWQALDARADSLREISTEDSTRAEEAAAEGGRALVELDRLLRDSLVDQESLVQRTALLLDSAESALETAFHLNPFDSRSKLWLSRVYELQARRLGQLAAYQRAIEELEKLVRLTPDQHAVFAMLANNYYRVEQWDRAAANYEHAEAVYRETYDLSAERQEDLDSTLLFSYVRAQADMHVRRLDAARAVAAFGSALEYAPSSEDTAYVEGEVDWIAWDDMNIGSSFARDSLAATEQAGDLEGARSGYLQLLPRLRARGAIDEVDWRLAIVDYNLGHAEEAAGRLQSLAARIEVDSLGAPVDSVYVKYLDDYGTVCLNLGRDYLHDRRDNRTALKYFEQAAHVVWDGRAAAHLEIATLVRSNLDIALENAGRALAEEDHLSVDQRKSLYRLLMSLYRRAGDFEQARRFRDNLRSLQSP